jgi:hypothetical protein
MRKVCFHIVLVSLLMLFSAGCNSIGEKVETPTTVHFSSTPSPLIEVEVSFPNGAPSLNQTAELICTVITREKRPAINMGIEVDLPDALELVSGELSWQADFVPADSNISVIQARVKSIKTGNWTIDIMVSLDPEENGGYHGGNRPIYVSILVDSAEWRTSAPFGLPTPLTISPDENLPPPPAITP